MCLTLLQELKGRLYFEDSSDSNCVNSIILLNFVYSLLFFQYRERSGSVVECLTWDRGAAGSSLTVVTVLCP